MTSYEKDILKEYMEWLCSKVCQDEPADEYSYSKLFDTLFETEFVYYMSGDANRADDGVQLRRRFCLETRRYKEEDLYFLYDKNCSVLEMMVALALRCEETIMDNPLIGDRTGQWFWSMISTLGLSGEYNQRFNHKKVMEKLDDFMERQYSPDGKGGLFYIRNADTDLRDVEIWIQLNWYVEQFAE